MGRIKSMPSGSAFAGRSGYRGARTMPVMPRREEQARSLLQGETFGIREIMQILALGEAVIQDKGIIGATTHALSRAYRSSKLEDAREQAAQARAIPAEFRAPGTPHVIGGPQPQRVVPSGTPADPTGTTEAEFVSPVTVTPSGPMTAIPMDADTVAPLGDLSAVTATPSGQPQKHRLIKAFDELEGALSRTKQDVPVDGMTDDQKELINMARKAANIPTGDAARGWGYGGNTQKVVKRLIESGKFGEPEAPPQPAEATPPPPEPEVQTPIALSPSIADVAPDATDYEARLRAILDSSSADSARRRKALSERGILTERDLLRSMAQVKSPEELVYLMSTVPELVKTDPEHAPRSLGELMGYDSEAKVQGVWQNMARAFQFLQRPDVETQRKIQNLMQEAKLHEMGLRQEERRARAEERANRLKGQSDYLTLKIDALQKKSQTRGRAGGGGLATGEWSGIINSLRNPAGMIEPSPETVGNMNKADLARLAKEMGRVRDTIRTEIDRQTGIARAGQAGEVQKQRRKDALVLAREANKDTDTESKNLRDEIKRQSQVLIGLAAQVRPAAQQRAAEIRAEIQIMKDKILANGKLKQERLKEAQDTQ